MLIQVLHYENVEKRIFPPQKDYMKEISQLLVHTLEEIRERERESEEGRERTKEREGAGESNADKTRQKQC